MPGVVLQQTQAVWIRSALVILAGWREPVLLTMVYWSMAHGWCGQCVLAWSLAKVLAAAIVSRSIGRPSQSSVVPKVLWMTR